MFCLVHHDAYVVVLHGSQALNKYFHNKAMAIDRLHLAWHDLLKIYLF